MTRNVAVVTGTRAEYGLLRSSMEAIRSSEALSLSVLATGMHLSPRHGSTIEEIRDDGFEVDRTVHSLLVGDDALAHAKSVGIGVSGMAEAFGDLEPDVVLVLGDRPEALAGAVAAAYLNVPVAHVHGGDATHGGMIDDSARHALTKFAHLHFPASDRSKDRILALGEEAWRVTTAGAPGLDDVLEDRFEDESTVRDALGLDTHRRLAVVLQHPVTAEFDSAGRQMRATLDAVAAVGVQAVVVHPNADPGGEAMVREIESHPSWNAFLVFENLPRERYLGLLAAADVLVGNSSSGIIESPSFGLPTVDVGRRQEGRQRAGNVQHVDHDPEAIRAAIERCLYDPEVIRRAATAQNPYSQGGAGDLIADRLDSVSLDESLLRKPVDF